MAALRVRCPLVLGLVGTVLGASLVLSTAATGAANASDPDPVSLHLVSARDHIEGSFTTNQAVYADRSRVYLASQQGTLFVLARDRAANFPLVQTVHDTSARLTAVRGDDVFVYVASSDGALRVYANDPCCTRLRASRSASPRNRSPSSTSLYVGSGWALVAADERHVYLSALNPGDAAHEIAKGTWTAGRVYGGTAAERQTTVVFDRLTGERVTGLFHGSALGGGLAQWALSSDGTVLTATLPGCCGSGMAVYDAHTLAPDPFVNRNFINTVVRRGRWLLTGGEDGTVTAVPRGGTAPAAILDLKWVTGHTRVEDIEIRSLWADSVDGLVFGGSSWGNDRTRGPDLPSLFVLEASPGRGYGFETVSLGAFTDPTLTTPVDLTHLTPGQSARLAIDVENTGSATWFRDGANPVLLGTERPRDRASRYFTRGWIGSNRPARVFQTSVAPGAVGTFVFTIVVPPGPGPFDEHFNLVAEHLTWFPDVGLAFHTVVQPATAPSYAWTPVATEAWAGSAKKEPVDLTRLAPGRRAWLVVRARNTGTATWHNTGPNPVQLGTEHPKDRSSRFSTTGWRSRARPARLAEAAVAPGRVGTFEFPIAVPPGAGTFDEHFGLVAEFLTWFPDAGLQFRLRVR